MDKRTAGSGTAHPSRGQYWRNKHKANHQRKMQIANKNSTANADPQEGPPLDSSDETKRNHQDPDRNRRQKFVVKDLVLSGTTDNNKSNTHCPPEKAYSSRNIIASNFNQKGPAQQPTIYKPKSNLTADKSGSEDDESRRTPMGYDTMIDEKDIDEHIKPFLKRYGLDDARNYEQLTSHCFVRVVDQATYCALCCQKYERLVSIDYHLATQRHVDRFLDLRSKLLNITPNLSSINMIALQILLKSWVEHNSLTESQYNARITAINDFNSIVAQMDPRCQCRIIGSFMAGNSLGCSDVNLEFLHPNSALFQNDPRAKNSIHHKLVDPEADYGNQINNHTMHYDLISNAVDSLYKIATCINLGHLSVKSFTLDKETFCQDLNAKVPKLVLTHRPTNVVLEVWCHAETSYQLACLLRNYMSLDDRVRDLSVLVKKWARICRISKPNQGTFTPETFVILVIHFLQRVQPPVLPCLHDLLGKNDNKSRKKRDTATESKTKPDETNLSDSDMNEECTKLVDSDAEIIENDNDEVPEEETEGEEAFDCDFDQAAIEGLNWKSENSDPLHKLFVEFMKFSMDQFAHTNNVITIRTLKKITLHDKKWFTQVKPIENPVRPSVNLSKNIGSIRTHNYIRECFSYGYYYLTSLPMIEGLKRLVEPRTDPTGYIRLYMNMKRFDFYFKMKKQQIERGKGDLIDGMIKQDLFARDVAVIKQLVEYSILHNRHLDTIPRTVANNYDKRLLMPRDKMSTVLCWLCRSFNHEKIQCPKGRKITISESEIDPEIDTLVDLDAGFLELYVNDMIRLDIAEKHSEIVKELEETIRNGTGLDCCLELFGSTVNLLGSADSDLDICMTLRGHPTGRGVDCVKVLKKTYQVLRKNRHVEGTIEPILAARVPIIKFKYDKFDIDLSMYNQCAIHNSKLLRTYVLIDPRVAQLCYIVKRFAKSCGIADASKGSLSSYAWSLLTIHFLQHTNPPILPVLQETKLEKKPIFGVNGWNVWFNENYDAPGQPENDTGLTALFKEFLLYYAAFDFDQFVISIRTSRLITKFQKNWTYCMIAIEDPFELTYNLSGRLDDPMALYIMNSFPKAYKYINQYQKTVRRGLPERPGADHLRMLFNGRAIMGCEPPNRGCRLCQKIGHRIKDCPARRQSKPANYIAKLKDEEPKTTSNIRKIDSKFK